jgi:hypothetical protein
MLNKHTTAQMQIKHQRTMGGYSDDFLQAMDLTSDGGVIVGGTSISGISGEKTSGSRGFQDFWMLKLNSKGEIKWDKTIGGDNQDYLRFIKQTTDGGYMLIGTSNSDISGEKTQNSKGDFDYWVVKLNKQQNVVWDKTIGGNSADFFSSAQETNDGGFILAGYSYSGKSSDKTENSRGDFDYWVVKISSSGKIEWDKTIGGNYDDLLTSVVQTADGGYILGGHSISDISGEKTEPVRGQYDYWIVKISCSGKVEWDKTIGGSSWDYLESIEQTKDGGYIVGGYSFSNKSGDKTENSKGATDYWIVKLNRKGKIEWDKTIGGAGDDIITCVHQTADGGYLAGGSSYSSDLTEKALYNRNDYDYLFVKTDNFGNVQWNKMIGGYNDDFLSGMKKISNDYWITGGSSLSGKTEDKDQRCRGGYDFWVTVLKSEASTELASQKQFNSNIADVNDKTFLVYPNPANSLLNVQTKRKGTFVLADGYGKKIITQTINGNGSIDVSSLPSGIYFLKNVTTSEVKKIIVAR